MATTQPPLFYPGETAGTAANLNAWMQFLETQIVNLQSALGIAPGSAGAAAAANATGASSGRASAVSNFIATGTGSGIASVVATGSSNRLGSSSFTLTSTSTGRYVGNATAISTFADTSGCYAAAFSQPSSYGVASGSSTAAGVGGSSIPASFAITGTSIGQSLSNRINTATAHAVGTSSVAATGSGSASEAANNTAITQPSQQIFASSTPGAASTTFNTFALPTNPGTPVVNGTADATQPATTELYYQNHYVYAQNTANAWTRWVSTGNWTPVASPLPAAAVTESVEGTAVTTVGPVIYASSTAGSAAAASATVGNGLDTWAINSSGQLLHNGVADTTTSSVTLIYYHNHSLWQQNSAGNWYVWNGTNYPQSATSPYPTSPRINVSNIPNAATNTTFVVSGTYQDYATPSANNLIPNSSGQGAVSGTPGTLPNGWTDYLPSGMTRTIVGFGTDTSTGTALPYVDYKVSGTPTAGGQGYFVFSSAVPVTAGSSYYFNSYISASDTSNLSYAQTDWYDNSTGSGVYDGNVSGTLTAIGGTGSASTGGTSATVYVLYAFNNATPTTVTFRFAAPQVNPGTTLAAFTSTPIASGVPTLEFSDNNSASYSSFSSTANVTSSTWSFVHPPVPSVSSSFTVSVRDHNNTGVVGVSPAFSIYTPGVTTLTGLTLGGLSSGGTLTISGSQPSGTVVGQVVVAATPGSFSGTIAVSGTSASSFTVNASKQLVTAAALGAGSYSITLTATQAGAAGSPLTASYTIVATAESQPQTTVTTVGPTITGSSTPGSAGSQLVWALANAVTSGTTNYQVTLGVNGAAPTIQTSTTAATTLYYFNHTLYQMNSSGNWYMFNGTITSGQAQWTACYSPYPIIVLTNDQNVSGTTQYDGQVSVVGANGVATDNFAPTTDNFADQLFLIQTESNGQMLSYAAGPKSYTVTGTDAARFRVYNSGSNWYLQANNVSISAGTYSISITATY